MNQRTRLKSRVIPEQEKSLKSVIRINLNCKMTSQILRPVFVDLLKGLP